MFGWSTDVYNTERLDIQKIADIIVFMKQTSVQPPEYIYAGSNPGNTSLGKTLFTNNCGECHGDNGKGLIAPALNNQEFLSAASNGYILATITIGRSNTKMPGWGYESEEYKVLSSKEREDITAFIRSWQRINIKF